MKNATFRVRITLFWRLFLSLLLTILMTSVLSIMVERWLVEKELTARMDVQIDSLLIKREEIVEALKVGDFAAVREMYRQDRRLMNQIRVYDEEDAIIFPRYRERDDQRKPERRQRNEQAVEQSSIRTNSNQTKPAVPPAPRFDTEKMINGENRVHEKPSILDHILQPIMPRGAKMADPDTRPELADVTIALPDKKIVLIQLRPHLRFSDVVELQRSNFPIRLLLILLFSILVCVWLSRTLTYSPCTKYGTPYD